MRARLFCVRVVAAAGLLIGSAVPALASRDILLDRPVRAGALTFFPKYKDEKTFYYLPDKPRLAVGKKGKPVFGFILFVKNVPPADADFMEDGIGRSVAEGFLNFAVELDVDDETKRQAALELSRKVPGAQVAGPVTYQSGQVFVTSTLEDEEKTKIVKIIGAGKAPVMEGHRSAVGLRLTAEGATLLRESLKQGAGQLAITFDMNVVGLRDSCDAELKGDFSVIASNEAMAAGLRSPVLGLDVQRVVNQLRTDRAYTFDIKGDCARHEQAMRNAEGQVVRMLFEVETDPQVLQTLQTDPNLYSNFDRASQMLEEERQYAREEDERAAQAEHLPLLDILPLGEPAAADGPPGAGNTPGTPNNNAGSPGGSTPGSPAPASSPAPGRGSRGGADQPAFSLLAAYRQKSYQRSGRFNFNWRQATYDTQSLPFAYVPGSLARLLSDPEHYLVVNYEDPAYRQRLVVVTLDGMDAGDFGRFVNHVVFRLSKRHRNGELTQREIRFDKRSFADLDAAKRVLVYGTHGDRNDESWNTFEYETIWSLYGGAEWRTGPQRTTNHSLALSPPHRVRELRITADPNQLAEQGVLVTTVNLYFDLFGKQRSERVELHALSGNPHFSEMVRWACPATPPSSFEYEVLWTMQDGQVRRSGRRRAGETDTLVVHNVVQAGS